MLFFIMTVKKAEKGAKNMYGACIKTFLEHFDLVEFHNFIYPQILCTNCVHHFLFFRLMTFIVFIISLDLTSLLLEILELFISLYQVFL